MICENCNNDNDGTYGSGRFCGSKCSRSFSTKVKRNEINIKVSETLKNKNSKPKNGFKKGFDSRRKTKWSDEEKELMKMKIVNFHLDKNKNSLFDELSMKQKRTFILNEQNNSCLWCLHSEWRGHKIKFELDHIDGNVKNNSRDNLRILCPNCHSQTETWRKKKNK